MQSYYGTEDTIVYIILIETGTNKTDVKNKPEQSYSQVFIYLYLF